MAIKIDGKYDCFATANLLTHQISGVISRSGAQGKYKVIAVDRNTFLQKGCTISASDGRYVIKFLQNSIYYVVAFDNVSPLLNAAIADLVTPEPML